MVTSPNLSTRSKMSWTAAYLSWMFSPFAIPTYGYPLGHFTFGIPVGIWCAYALLVGVGWLCSGVILAAIWEDV